MRLEQLLEDSGLTVDRASAAAEVTEVAFDSRQVERGSLFCCLPGEHADGHQFAAAAVERGAVALLAERRLPLEVPQILVAPGRARPAMAALAAALEGHPDRALITAGVTGTNGKTTVTHLLAAILDTAGLPCTVIGTLAGARTTPEAPVLQRTLAETRDRGGKAVAMEVSSHALSQSRVDAMAFDVAVFTNLSHDHLDYHGTLEAYFAAKASLFTPERARYGVVNADDPYGARLLANGAISMAPYSLLDVGDVEVASRRTSFTWRQARISLALTGSYNVGNAIAAGTAALALGLDLRQVVDGLARAAPVPGRFEVVDVPGSTLVIVDYAHTPDALAVALASARQLSRGRSVLCVFGCGGDRDRTKRPKMGETAHAGADLVVVTSDNPRGEDPDAIIADVLEGMPDRSRLVVEPNRRSALEVAFDLASPGDVVLIAGKGHETTIEAGGRVVPFDDRREAAAAAARSLDRQRGSALRRPR